MSVPAADAEPVCSFVTHLAFPGCKRVTDSPVAAGNRATEADAGIGQSGMAFN